MVLDDFINIVRAIDPAAARYEALGQKGDAYTVYAELNAEPLYADGVPAEVVEHVQVDYYTRDENDPTARRFLDAFTQNDLIACEYQTDFESDTRYIHHIYDCEVVCNGEADDSGP